ncbi:MAG: Mor transcription activator family protein [Methylovulum miyakonense]|uniref:Mor transcription activator family protein n=1 Tax=Methylovulum miyakonense TaxID=645578 RepID=UPI003BB4A810
MNGDDALIDESLLPPQMRLLIKCIGLPETIGLLKAKGGTTVKFPQHADNCYQFEGILQPQSVAALAYHLGGTVMELPKYDKIAIQLRDMAIRAARHSTTAPQLARQYNLSRRMIIYICGGTSIDDRQMRLSED